MKENKEDTTMEYISLNNGVKMPILGYGVYQVTKEECERCVHDALKVGYRAIDTAQSYFNEEEVGNAIQKSGIPREEIFLTTKVWVEHYGYEEAKKSVLESMKKLKTDYLDLVLLHQPFSDVYGAYRALEDLYDEGKIRAIGISNFYVDRMVDFASFNRIKPMVNQVETHIFNQQKEMKEWADKYDIRLEAWAPFGEGRGGTFENPVISEIAEKYQKTPAQVMLRWHIQRGVVVIPKSTHIERMEENFNVFDFTLSDEDIYIGNNIQIGGGGITPLNQKKWKEFYLSDIFTDIQRGKRLKTADHIQGNIPYVSSSAVNNGVDALIGNTAKIRKFADCLTLANSGSVGKTFYHKYEFIASDHVTALKSDRLNEYSYLFVATIVQRLENKYSFNREINDMRINKEKIVLPIDEFDKPDYAFMEQYVKQQIATLKLQYRQEKMSVTN